MPVPLGVGGPYSGTILYLSVIPALNLAVGTIRADADIYGTFPPGVGQAPAPTGYSNDFQFTVSMPTTLQVGQSVTFYVAQSDIGVLFATDIS